MHQYLLIYRLPDPPTMDGIRCSVQKVAIRITVCFLQSLQMKETENFLLVWISPLTKNWERSKIDSTQSRDMLFIRQPSIRYQCSFTSFVNLFLNLNECYIFGRVVNWYSSDSYCLLCWVTSFRYRSLTTSPPTNPFSQQLKLSMKSALILFNVAKKKLSFSVGS